jgi:hypothetical protein
MKKISYTILALASAFPLLASAQGINLSYITPYSDGIINVINNILVPVLIALAFIVFLWGVYKYYIYGADNEAERTTGHQFILWGVIGFVVILSLWGLVNLVMGTFGLTTGRPPAFPTLGGSSAQTGGNTLFTNTGSNTVSGPSLTGTTVYNPNGTVLGQLKTDGFVYDSNGQISGRVLDGKIYDKNGNQITGATVQASGGTSATSRTIQNGGTCSYSTDCVSSYCNPATNKCETGSSGSTGSGTCTPDADNDYYCPPTNSTTQPASDSSSGQTSDSSYNPYTDPNNPMYYDTVIE